MKVLLIVNAAKEEAVRCARRAGEILTRAGAEWSVSQADRPAGADACAEGEAVRSCDVVVTIGGDGTLLHAAPQAARWQKPILGVNVGRVGFLATVEATELELLAKLVENEYTLDERLMLAARVDGGMRYRSDALNDVVVSKGAGTNTIRFDIYCDGTLVNSYRGDGVVIATPTGSTAYSLSAGGPILDARIGGILVTPICAHSLNTPPMVFSAQRSLRIVTAEHRAGGAYLSTDGRDYVALGAKDDILIGLSQKHLSLVSFCEADQFRAIDKKLKGR